MVTITTVIYFIYKWLIWFQFNKGITQWLIKMSALEIYKMTACL